MKSIDTKRNETKQNEIYESKEAGLEYIFLFLFLLEQLRREGFLSEQRSENSSLLP